MNKNIESYIDGFDAETRKRLLTVREIFFSVVPDAEEDMKYRMPTIIWHGNLVHYAAFKNHIGVYPLPHALEALREEIRPYKTGKGSIQFGNDEPLPVDLIRRIIEVRKEEKERELSEKTK
jgi:Uncharacterized conserved protein